MTPWTAVSQVPLSSTISQSLLKFTSAELVVQSLGHVWLFATLSTAACQAPLSFTVSQSLLKFMSMELVMLSNLCWHHFLFAFNLSQRQGLFQWIGYSHQVAKVLELQLQHQSFQWIFSVYFLCDWLVWSCSPRDSQESSSTPQFKSISSLVLSFLCCPTLTSIHDYWKNHSFD